MQRSTVSVNDYNYYEKELLRQMSNNNIIEPPEFNPKESMPSFLRRVEAYNIKIKRKKYNFILTFLNLWLVPYKITLQGLLDFKKIDITSLNNEEHNKKIFDTYVVQVKEHLNLDYNHKKQTKKELPIIQLLKKMLSTIDHGILEKKYYNKIYYTIINKKITSLA
jgi:hypothetical protein